MNQTEQRNGGVETLIVGLLIAGAILGLILWAGAQLASLVADGRSFPATAQDTATALMQMKDHLGDPREAWAPSLRDQLPGPVLYWAASGMVLLAGGAVGGLGWKLFRGPQDALDRRVRAGVAAQGRLARPAELRPLLVRRPVPGRFVIGRLRRRFIATEALTMTRRPRRRRMTAGPGAVMAVGPSRSGKTTNIMTGVFHWPGPSILVSLKGDFLDATERWRASLGEVKVFDPSGVTGKKSATWSPLATSRSVSGAVRAARQLAEAAPRGSNAEDGAGFWLQMAESLLAALLVVAANSEKTFADVVQWVVSSDMPNEKSESAIQPLARALKADADKDRKEAGEFALTVLEGLWRNDHRTVSGVYATARTIVWPWVDPLVAKATSDCDIDLDWLLKKNGTLYICIPLNDQHRLRPVLGGLLNDLVGQAFERFVKTGKPLDPPLLIVIDEAATLRPDQLPSWASTVSGIGVQLVTAWQSVAQIEAAYGRQSQAIMTNHLTKLFFAGMSDPAGLEYVSHLLGDEHVSSRLSTARASGSDRLGVTGVPVVPPSALRQLRPGDALLLHGTLPPAHVRTRPWYRDRHLRSRGR